MFEEAASNNLYLSPFKDSALDLQLILKMNQFLSTILTFSFIISPSQGFLDNWYMVPPLGTTLVLNLIENRTTVLTLIDQPAAVKYESQIPDVLEVT